MYTVQNFTHLLGTPGFSNELLQNHTTLYAGYVKNTNDILEKLAALESGTPEYLQLRRRFNWEFAGMRLHELYFSNMKNEPARMLPSAPLHKKMTQQFGSADAALDDFRNAAATRGVGWVVLYHDTASDTLFNVWIDDHHSGHLPGCIPLLVMDMWEHAFVLDYGLKKAEYIDAFLAVADWGEVNRRFEKAV